MRHGRMILQHGNAPCHRTTIIRNTIKILKWDLISHSSFSPELALSDFHLYIYYRTYSSTHLVFPTFITYSIIELISFRQHSILTFFLLNFLLIIRSDFFDTMKSYVLWFSDTFLYLHIRRMKYSGFNRCRYITKIFVIQDYLLFDSL